MEAADAPRSVLQFLAQFQVAVSGGGRVGSDAEGEQSVGVLLHQRVPVGHNALEFINGLDQVVGGEDGDHRLGVAPGNHRRAVPGDVDGVAADRLPQVAIITPSRQRAQDRFALRLARADVPPLGRNQPFQARSGAFQQAAAANERDQLLGQRVPAHGPEPEP